MKSQITSSLVVMSLILSPLMAYSDVTPGVVSPTPAPSAPSTQTGTADAQPSVKGGADQSKGGNDKAGALNLLTGGAQVVMGGVMIQQGMSTTPVGWGLVAMGTMMVTMGITNIAQGNEHNSAADSAGYTSGLTDGLGGLSSANPYADVAKNDPNYKAVDGVLKDLESKGIYNPKAGTYTVGDKTYKSSDFASAGAMAAAGFPQGMIDGAMAANAEAEKKALAKLEKVKIGAATAANGYEEGGGGGGGMSADGSSAGAAGYAGYGGAGGLGKTGKERDPSSLAGMSKNYNGEPIGVAADSIFLMMSRRYKVKESQESFLGPADLALQK